MEIEGETLISKNSLPLITVAVPVYNAENHLIKCLDSILKQTYFNLDILLVNDGSTDTSAKICEEYQQKDNRVRVFHKKNEGIGASRNSLLNLIMGEYVTFVDNDDWIEENHIETLYTELDKHNSDISVSNFCSYVHEDSTFIFHSDFTKYFERSYTTEEWLKEQYESKGNMSQCFTVPWGKLYKSILFEGVSFPEDKAVEDDYTTYFVYLKASKITYIHCPTYIHRKSSQSITQTVSLTEVFPLQSVEERLTLLAILGYDLSDEIRAYHFRLKLHKQEYLNSGDIIAYRRVSTKLELIEANKRRIMEDNARRIKENNESK